MNNVEIILNAQMTTNHNYPATLPAPATLAQQVSLINYYSISNVIMTPMQIVLHCIPGQNVSACH